MGPKDHKCIAVVGVSDEEHKYGYRIFRDMLEAGYPVEAVNPKGGRILGRKRYKNLSEMPAKPDLVITVVPPEITEKVVGECAALGIGTVWMQPGSDSPAAKAAAAERGIKVISACFMVREGIW